MKIKSLIISLLMILLISGTSYAWPWDDYVYCQKVTFASIGTDAYSSDLGELQIGKGGLILWWMIESSASVDYDVHFFTEDLSSWENYIDDVEQVYKKVGITTSWYKDDTLIPFVDTSTAGSQTAYVGIYNDDGSHTSNFEMNVFWQSRQGLERVTDAN